MCVCAQINMSDVDLVCVRSYNVAQHLKACATTTRDIKGRRKRMGRNEGGWALQEGCLNVAHTHTHRDTHTQTQTSRDSLKKARQQFAQETL